MRNSLLAVALFALAAGCQAHRPVVIDSEKDSTDHVTEFDDLWIISLD